MSLYIGTKWWEVFYNQWHSGRAVPCLQMSSLLPPGINTLSFFCRSTVMVISVARNARSTVFETVVNLIYTIKVECLRSTKFCWAGKHTNIVMNPTNSPTQRQPDPRNIRLKVAIWATFSHSEQFFGGWGFILDRKQTTRNPTQPNYPQTPQ